MEITNEEQYQVAKERRESLDRERDELQSEIRAYEKKKADERHFWYSETMARYLNNEMLREEAEGKDESSVALFNGKPYTEASSSSEPFFARKDAVYLGKGSLSDVTYAKGGLYGVPILEANKVD